MKYDILNLIMLLTAWLFSPSGTSVIILILCHLYIVVTSHTTTVAAADAADGADSFASTWAHLAAAMAEAATRGAERTRTMGGRAGRSSYINDEDVKGTPDPGAMAAAYALQAITLAVVGSLAVKESPAPL